MAFKMKGYSAFTTPDDDRGTIEKPMEFASKELSTQIPQLSELQKKKNMKKEFVSKSKYTGRTPQSQMTDEERAAQKGIEAPQTTMKLTEEDGKGVRYKIEDRWVTKEENDRYNKTGRLPQGFYDRPTVPRDDA